MKLNIFFGGGGLGILNKMNTFLSIQCLCVLAGLPDPQIDVIYDSFRLF